VRRFSRRAYREEMQQREAAFQKERSEEKSRENWKLYSRSQWRRAGRKVHRDTEPTKVYVTKAGHHMQLFSLAQTVEMSPEELMRDGWQLNEGGWVLVDPR